MKRLLAIYYQQDLTTRYFTISTGRSMYVWLKKPKKNCRSRPGVPGIFWTASLPLAASSIPTTLSSPADTSAESPATRRVTDELALLHMHWYIGGVSLRLTARQVTPAEEDAILHAAANKIRMERSNVNDLKQSVTAEAKLRDVVGLVEFAANKTGATHHCAVYLDIAADSPEKLRAAREVISAQLMRSKIGTDSLLLRQKDGFASANPAGGSVLASFAERVLPARSVANLYPMNYSGKTDPEGFFIGRDRFGANIIVDLFRRAPDKTNSNVLILGNSGQGKSFLLKLLLCNVRGGRA